MLSTLRKHFLFTCFTIFSCSLFAQNNNNTINFIKGNITDKTTAVRQSTGTEAVYLTNKAIDFALENKEALGNDRELDGLVVAAVLSINSQNLQSYSDAEKKQLINNLKELYAEFSKSSTVEIAILNKISAIRNNINISDFVDNINTILKTTNLNDMEPSVLKTTLSTLEQIGNVDTFIILYFYLSNQKYKNYTAEISRTITALSPMAMNEILNIIQDSTLSQLKLLFDLLKNNPEISKNNLCLISENVLSKSILLMGSSSKISSDDIDLQLETLQILSDNKWTRASTTVLSYFQISKQFYASGYLNESQFITVISSLGNITPVNAVSELSGYLEELNKQTENGEKVSSEVILSVINSLGAIGDKSAFDSLLAVTYLNYSESVLSAAREALSGLRWQ